MATAYLRAESAPVILPHNFAQAATVMAQFDRDKIASAVEVLVNLLDVLDGDADLEGQHNEDELSTFPPHVRDALDHGPGCTIADSSELYGDETDGNGAEDEPCAWFPLYRDGAGCPVADNGLADTGGLYEQKGCDTDELIPGGGSLA